MYVYTFSATLLESVGKMINFVFAAIFNPHFIAFVTINVMLSLIIVQRCGTSKCTDIVAGVVCSYVWV